jgi:ATP-dependent DNA ligase
MGLEGNVSKRADSFYRGGPSRRWLKTKCWTESEFLVVGAEIDSRGLPVARLARVTDEGLATAGAAIIALREAERDRLHRTLEKITGRHAIAASAPRVVVKHLKGSGPIRHATVRRFAE